MKQRMKLTKEVVFYKERIKKAKSVAENNGNKRQIIFSALLELTNSLEILSPLPLPPQKKLRKEKATVLNRRQRNGYFL